MEQLRAEADLHQLAERCTTYAMFAGCGVYAGLLSSGFMIGHSD